MSEYTFSPQSQIALQVAQKVAAEKGHVLVTTGHVLMGILHTEIVPDEDFGPAILLKYRITPIGVNHLLKHCLGERDELPEPRPLARETQEALARAELVREAYEDSHIRTEHLLVGLAENRMNVAAHTLNLRLIQAEIKLRRSRTVA